MDYLRKLKSKYRRQLMSPEERKREDELVANFRNEEKKLIEVLEERDRAWRDTHRDDPPDYGEYIAPTLGLKRRDMITTTNDELLELAKKKYKGAYDRNGILARHKDDYSDTKSAIDDINSSANDALASLASRVKSKRRSARNIAHAKGMLKSSTARLVDDAIVDEASESASDIDSDRISSIDAQKKKLDALNRARDEALEALDIKEAKAIRDELSRLIRRRDDTNDAVLEYNNSVDRKEKEYALNRRKAIEKMQDDFIKRKEREAREEYWNGYRGAKKREYQERRSLAEKLYNEVPREIAVEAIKKNPRLRVLLGKYYSALLSTQGARK